MSAAALSLLYWAYCTRKSENLATKLWYFLVSLHWFCEGGGRMGENGGRMGGEWGERGGWFKRQFSLTFKKSKNGSRQASRASLCGR